MRTASRPTSSPVWTSESVPVSFFDEVTAEDPGRERSSRRRVWLVLGMLVALAAAAYVVLHQAADDRVPLGTTVAGVPVGGLSAAAAEQRLSERLDTELQRSIQLVHDNQTFGFVPAESGLNADWPGTVAATGAGANRWSPAALWHYFTAGRSVAARFDVEPQRFTDALDTLTARIGRPAVEGTIEFRDGRARPVYGHTGLVVDHAHALAIVERLTFDHHRALLPVSVRHPYVSRTAVRTALRDFARPAMSGPVRVFIGGHRVIASPRLFGKAINMIPSRGGLVPLVDGKQLVAALRPAMRSLGPRPRDARVTIRNGRPHVVPAVYGASYDADELAQRFPKALVKKGAARVVRVHAALTKPHRTTAAVRGLGIREPVGGFTVTGGTALVDRLHNVLIPPGGSLKLSDRLGTGSRPLGTALFTAALRAGAKITSWASATTYDRSLPVGKQATDVTVAPQSGPHGLLVDARRDGSDQVRVTIWSTPVRQVKITVAHRTMLQAPGTAESTMESCMPRAGVPGFEVTVHRRVVVSRGQRLPGETFTSSYAPVEEIRCASTSPSPEPDAAGQAAGVR